MSTNDDFNVFYVWQACNRISNKHLIKAALNSACRALVAKGVFQKRPIVEHDTRNLPGAPDIGLAIMAKIDASHLYVGDVSITHHDGSRSFPNSNVLVETGYAIKSLGPDRLVLVMNLAMGQPEDLPFDLNKKRVVKYTCEPDADAAIIETATSKLATDLVTAIRTIAQHDFKRGKPTPVQKMDAALALVRGANELIDSLDYYFYQNTPAPNDAHEQIRVGLLAFAQTCRNLTWILGKAVTDAGFEIRALLEDTFFKIAIWDVDPRDPNRTIDKYSYHATYASEAYNRVEKLKAAICAVIPEFGD